MRRETYGWLETELIGEALNEAHPEIDPMRVGFVQLKQLVMELEGFEAEPGHPCNEKILEHIQAAWIEERGGGRKVDED